MNIIIPIGGQGKRFKDSGYDVPKPLININGKKMIYYLLDNLNVDETDIIYIIYHNNLDEYNFQDLLRRRYDYKFIFTNIDYNTRGAVETILSGINNNEFDNKEILILDSDTFYKEDIISNFKLIKDNCIFYFNDYSKEPIFSYIKIKENNVIDIKEKEKISNYANVGAYGIKDIKTLKYYCELIINDAILSKNEFYISTIYSLMIKEEITIKTSNIEKFHCLGTPEQLMMYANSSEGDKKRFCFDFDNTLVSYPTIKNDYTSCKPLIKNINFLNFLKEQGHYIIIYTARRMKTHKGIVGKVIADIGEITLKSLKDFNIEYDEIVFGKPYADFYIDDLMITPHKSLEKQTGFYNTSIEPRTFNKIEYYNNSIKKISENIDFDGEIYFYKNIPIELDIFFPKMINSDEKSIEIEKINGINFSFLHSNNTLTYKHFDILLNNVVKLHKLNINHDYDIYSNYSKKMELRYNNYDYSNFENSENIFKIIINKLKEYEINDYGMSGVIHGDMVFSNILIDINNNIKFIDMRGKLGDDLTIYGDIYYDYAKIYQSCIGYDFILNDKKEINNNIELYFERYFIEAFGEKQFHYLKFLTASLLFSLIPLHDNDKCEKYYGLIKKLIK